MFVPYFVTLIYFVQCAKNLFTAIKSAPVSAFISDFFKNFIGKQNEHYLNLCKDFCQVTIENQRFQGLCKMDEPLVLLFLCRQAFLDMLIQAYLEYISSGISIILLCVNKPFQFFTSVSAYQRLFCQ